MYPSTGDLDAVRTVAETAREGGLLGQAVIHPDQVPVVNEVFAPSSEAARRAAALVERFEASEHGPDVIEGEFLDESLVDRYRLQLRRYEAVPGTPP